MALKTGKNLFKKIGLSHIVVAAIFISSLIYFLSLKEREENFKLELQGKLNAVSEEKSILEDELKKANAEKAMMEETITKLNTKMGDLTKDLDVEKNSTQDLSARLAENEKEFVKLKAEISSLKEEKETMQLKIIEAKSKIDSLETLLGQLQTAKSQLQRKLDNIMNKRLEVELEKVIIKPKTPGVARVLAVNNSYKFVVINLGREHGMQVGKIMAVYQKGELTAKVKVEKIYETMSVADIIFEASPGIIQDEDQVREISSDVPPLSAPSD